MGRKSADKILVSLVKALERNLEELSEPSPQGNGEFINGEKTAYVECLEYIQYLAKQAYGLDFDIEDRYPLV